MRHFIPVIVAAIVACPVPVALAQGSFVNFETAHVSPLDITPDGSKLLAVNTADNRLEVFTLTPSGPIHAASVTVGLDPVSVRARSNTEAWVVNSISDSVSIVDLAAMNVKATLAAGDEPADVVFAGSPLRAFISVAGRNQVRVFNPLTLAQIGGPLTIQGQQPRALATDGVNVYVAIFESGNRTTILPESIVSDPQLNPYPGDPNPPPNNGSNFLPTPTPGLPVPPRVGLIVKRDAGANIWRDDNPSGVGDWSAAVTWNLHDHDVAVINANSLAVTYISGLMNLNMHLAVRPAGAGGGITVVGTDAINQVRFEPNVRGVFGRVIAANAGQSTAVVDLNPHLSYASPNVPMAQRLQSIGDPRGIAWRADGQRAFITGMGSNNVIVVNASLGRTGRIDVGQGPTGVKIDEQRGLVYVLNKFDATISVISESQLVELAQVAMYDPTPQVIHAGRPHLYNTHQTSGLGHVSCATCHVDARIDQIAWDLGNPAGQMQPFDQTCEFPAGQCADWHPMKGPMTTQTLIGIVGGEPLHWRGDRQNLAAFNPAFQGLMGADGPLTSQQMQEFEDFIATIRFPPQPNRNLDNSLPTGFPNGGNPSIGEFRFTEQIIEGQTCVSCHALPQGTSGSVIPAETISQTQGMNVPQLRNLHKKLGFNAGSSSSDRGFGFTHDGGTDSVFQFLQGFNIGGPDPDGHRLDLEAFLMCFPSDTHAAVGAQETIINGSSIPPQQQNRLNQFFAIADTGAVSLVAKGRANNAGTLEQRGWAYGAPATFQSDRAGQTIAASALLASAAAGQEITITIVPSGSQVRIGIDRDEDGFFDRDELDAGSDPADPGSTPNTLCPTDVDHNGVMDFDDVLAIIFAWGPCSGCAADIDGNGQVNFDDVLLVIFNWGACS